MKVLWKALNGQEFVVEGENLEDIKQKVALLREEHGIATPNVMLATAYDEETKEELKASADIDVDSLSEEDQEKFREAAQKSADKKYIKNDLN